MYKKGSLKNSVGIEIAIKGVAWLQPALSVYFIVKNAS
jgi:hypothetical protein